MSLTPAELALTKMLGEAKKIWMELEAMHPGDNADFVFHVHALQNIVMARAAQRDHPEQFPRQAYGTNSHMAKPT